jgi:hypothetical protein
VTDPRCLSSPDPCSLSFQLSTYRTFLPKQYRSQRITHGLTVQICDLSRIPDLKPKQYLRGETLVVVRVSEWDMACACSEQATLSHNDGKRNTVSVHHPVMFTNRSPHQLIYPTNSEAITPRRVDIIIQEVNKSYYLLLQNFYLT